MRISVCPHTYSGVVRPPDFFFVTTYFLTYFDRFSHTVFRCDSPLNSIRCALGSNRSNSASATVGFSINPYHSLTGSRLTMIMLRCSYLSSITSSRSQICLPLNPSSPQSSKTSRSSFCSCFKCIRHQ
jgi:hypothetical protein